MSTKELCEVTIIKRRYPDNEIVVLGNTAEMLLYDFNNQEKARAIIDADDIDVVAGVRWYLRPDGYVATSNYRGDGYRYLHSVIVGGSDSRRYGDHKDGNRLNNTKDNLRVASPSQNGMNKRIRSNNTSGRVGVHWSNQRHKWCAMICSYGKHKNLGYFDSFDEAVECRRRAEVAYFGEYKPQEERVCVDV